MRGAETAAAMIPPPDNELRSLVRLLDDEDPGSLEMVRKQIMKVGDPVLPFLRELEESPGAVGERAAAVARELRFKKLRREFAAVAAAAEPDLETGSLLLSRFAYPDARPQTYVSWLDRVAGQVNDELPSDADMTMTFQRLNSHLFQALGFCGNEGRYYDPDNSYLSRVIDTRRGVPISLSVLYLLLAKRLRLPVYGVATPGHFLVGFRAGGESCYLDPYHRGRLLDVNEVRRMLLRSGYEFRPEYVVPCSPRDILAATLRSLIAIYDKSGHASAAEMLSSLVEILLTARSARR